MMAVLSRFAGWGALTGAARGVGLVEVVPRAPGADLDHVAAAAPVAGGEGQGLAKLPYAPVVGLEVVRVDVGQQAQVPLFAHGAGPGGRLAHVPGRAHELGVGVADLQARQEPGAELPADGALGQRVVDRT